MKRITIVGALVVAFALGAVATASAAVQPEFKACVKVTEVVEKHHVGAYADKACTELAVPAKTGKYELAPVAAGTTFTAKAAKGTEMTLPAEGVKGGTQSVACKKSTVSGEITGASSFAETLKFEKCVGNKETKTDKCGNVSEGTIEGKVTGELFWLNAAETEPGALMTDPVEEFKCGSENVVVAGNLLGAVESGKHGPNFVFAGSGGSQAHKAFFIGGEEESPFFLGYELEGQVNSPHEVVFTATEESKPTLKGVSAR